MRKISGVFFKRGEWMPKAFTNENSFPNCFSYWKFINDLSEAKKKSKQKMKVNIISEKDLPKEWLFII